MEAAARLAAARRAAIRGDGPACRRLVERALTGAPRHDAAIEEEASTVVALLELGLRHPDRAVAVLEPMLRVTSGPGSRRASRRSWLADLVEAALHTGRRDLARAALSGPGSSVAAGESLTLRARMARAEALLADDDGVDVAFGRALALLAESPDVAFERARTELCYGERLRRGRRRTYARRHLRSALLAFERLGAAPWAARARAELQASSETARRRVSSGEEALTPQERAVARIVAAGATNREAAAALFLSPKTIEYHLGNAFGKLGVRTRTQLAVRFLTEGGAVPLAG